MNGNREETDKQEVWHARKDEKRIRKLTGRTEGKMPVERATCRQGIVNTFQSWSLLIT
jgi:hypothetical protein